MSKIIRSPEKQIQHKKKRRVLSALLFVGVVGLLFLVVWVPSIESLQIKRIVVEGNKVLAKEEVGKFTEAALSGKYFYAFPKTNFFLYPKEEVLGALGESFPRIATVSADLDSDRVLTILISEREPFALWCGREIPEEKADESCAYLDNGGFVFAKAPHFSGNAYFEFYGKGILPDGDPVGHDFLSGIAYQNILKVKERLENFQLKPVAVFVASDGGAAILEAAGYQIRFNVDQDVSALESNIQAVFRSDSWAKAASSNTLEYLDFRFGNKVYYKYKSQEAETKNQE